MRYFFTNIKAIGYLLSALLALYLINPLDKGFLFGYLIVMLMLIKRDSLARNVDLGFVLLLLFSIIYALFYSFDPTSGNQFIFIYALSPPVFYLLGKYLVEKMESSKQVFFLLFSIAFLFSIAALISVLFNFLEGGFAQLNRNIPMIWSDEPVAATKMGAFFTLNMCIPALLIGNQRKKSLIFNILALVVFMLSILCIIRLGSRTQIMIFLITSILSLFYVVPKQPFRKNVILIIMLGVVMLYLINKVSFDLNEDWLTTFAGRMDRSNDVASGGGRTGRWIKSFQNLFEKPLGWSLDEFGYSHNLWLDVLRVSGIIPFALLIIYSIRSFFQVRRTIRLNPDDISFNIIILMYAIAFFLIFMVEPIFEGIFSLFVVFCLFMGVINKYYANFKS